MPRFYRKGAGPAQNNSNHLSGFRAMPGSGGRIASLRLAIGSGAALQENPPPCRGRSPGLRRRGTAY